MDNSLSGNVEIEKCIAALQQAPTAENLAVTLTEIRHQMQAGKHFIVPVEAPGVAVPAAGSQTAAPRSGAPGSAMSLGQATPAHLQLMEVDGGKWLAAYTTFDEQLEGGGAVMSTFTAEIRQIFDVALREDSVKGVFLDPWKHALQLDKHLIHIILGK